MKEIYCISCEIKGKKKRRKGVIPVKDPTTGEINYMCEECFDEWQQLKLIAEYNGNTYTED